MQIALSGLSTYHVLHVGGRGVNLAPQLIVQVQDELGVAVSDGPLPPVLGLPPAALLVQVLVQDLAPASRVGQHHHGGSGVEEQQQGGARRPVWRRGRESHPRRWRRW